MVRLFRFIFYLTVALLALAFALLNSQTVKFDYYFGQWELPLSLMLAVATTSGAALGVMVSLGIVIRAKRESTALRKNAAIVEKELAKLRALPLNDEQ